jgi:hypothetical protein
MATIPVEVEVVEQVAQVAQVPEVPEVRAELVNGL